MPAASADSLTPSVPDTGRAALHDMSSRTIKQACQTFPSVYSLQNKILGRGEGKVDPVTHMHRENEGNNGSFSDQTVDHTLV